jgi:hypothetical protein
MPKPPRPHPARHLSSLKPQVRLDPGRLAREKAAHQKAKAQRAAEGDERALLNSIAEQKQLALAEAEAQVTEPSTPPSVAVVEEEISEILGEEVSEEEVLADLGEPPAEEVSEEVSEEPAAEEPAAEEPAKAGKTDGEIASLLNGTNAEIVAALETGAWDSVLKAVLDTESAGKNRKGARDSIQARIVSLG